MGAGLSQLFPPPPPLTEENLPSQKGKVFIVTGGASGIGYELSKILYNAGGTVYIAGRSEEKALRAILDIKGIDHDTYAAGKLEFLPLTLDDLSSIKSSVEAFKSKEERLDVLFNNAGVYSSQEGSLTIQGYERQLATNCLSPYLFTQLLLPMLCSTAEISPPNTVRVVWSSSQIVDVVAPLGGIDMSTITMPCYDDIFSYTRSKTGNWFLASELAREVGYRGIISITHNPGGVKTGIMRYESSLIRLFVRPLLHPAKYGAYTELWAGVSSMITQGENGGYVIPWGRMHFGMREDLLDALKTVKEGGTGQAGEFSKWCWEQTAKYR
jgi:NAD(P)-dependent dehydrogenase (short-subunit alcohol dehydrogenase family)